MPRYPISDADHAAIAAMLRQMESDLNLITNAAGPAYGAQMMDRVIKINHALHSLKLSIMDTLPLNAPINPYSPNLQWNAETKWWDMRPQRPHQLPRNVIRQRAATIIDPPITYDPLPGVDEPGWKRRKPPFTFREHLVVGVLLVQMHADLTDLFVNRLQYAYGKTHRTCQNVRRVIKRNSTLRSALDGVVCSEYPRTVTDIEGVPITHVYYRHGDRVQHREFLAEQRSRPGTLTTGQGGLPHPDRLNA